MENFNLFKSLKNSIIFEMAEVDKERGLRGLRQGDSNIFRESFEKNMSP